MVQLKTNCILCSAEIMTRLGLQFRANVLSNWKQNCVSSFCEALQLEPSLLRNTDFCPNCLQIVRDMDFLVRSIERFQKKLSALKTRAMAILINNSNHFDSETNLYAKTVKNVVKSLMGESPCSITNNSRVNSKPIAIATDDQTTEGFQITSASKNGSAGRFTRRNRLSRYSNIEEKSLSDIEIKCEPDDMDIEEHTNNSNRDPDPDFSAAVNSDSSIDEHASKATRTRKQYNRKSIAKRKPLKRGCGNICDFPNCGTLFRTRGALKWHIFRDHKEIVCTECDQKFEKRRELTAHCETVHGVKPVLFPCLNCGRSFRSKAGSKSHDCLALPPSQGLPKCSICSRVLVNEQELLTHMELHSNCDIKGIPFACVICNVDCVGIVGLQTHMSVHDDGFFKCSEVGCDQAFSSGYKLQGHIRTRHKLVAKSPLSTGSNCKPASKRKPVRHGRTMCDFPNCGAFFILPSSLQLHISRDHEKDSEPYKCSECELKFEKRQGLTAHSETVHGVQPILFPCTKCERSCRSKKGLELHMTIAHPATEGLPKCSICKLAFSNDDELQPHIELHNDLLTSDTPFACVLCNVDCGGISQLQTHVRIHDESLIKCSEPGCDQVFVAMSNLKSHLKRKHKLDTKEHLNCPKCKYQAAAPGALRRHMWKHEEGRTFVCKEDGCGKAFKFESTLKQHLTVDHDKLNRKTYPCNLCPKVFQKRDSLTSHQAHHSSNRPYLCEKCPLGFKTIQNLRGHRKVHLKETKGQRVLALQKPRKSRLPPPVPNVRAHAENNFRVADEDIVMEPQPQNSAMDVDPLAMAIEFSQCETQNDEFLSFSCEA